MLQLINKIPAIRATILNQTIMHLSMEHLLTIITQLRLIIHKLVRTIIDRMEDMVSRIYKTSLYSRSRPTVFAYHGGKLCLTQVRRVKKFWAIKPAPQFFSTQTRLYRSIGDIAVWSTLLIGEHRCYKELQTNFSSGWLKSDCY